MKFISFLIILLSSPTFAGPKFSDGIFQSKNEDNNRKCPVLKISYDGQYATFGTDGISYILYHYFYDAKDECKGFTQCYYATPTGDSLKTFEIYLSKNSEIERLEFSKNNSNSNDDRNCINFEKVE